MPNPKASAAKKTATDGASNGASNAKLERVGSAMAGGGVDQTVAWSTSWAGGGTFFHRQDASDPKDANGPGPDVYMTASEAAFVTFYGKLLFVLLLLARPFVARWRQQGAAPPEALRGLCAPLLPPRLAGSGLNSCAFEGAKAVVVGGSVSFLLWLLTRPAGSDVGRVEPVPKLPDRTLMQYFFSTKRKGGTDAGHTPANAKAAQAKKSE